MQLGNLNGYVSINMIMSDLQETFVRLITSINCIIQWTEIDKILYLLEWVSGSKLLPGRMRNHIEYSYSLVASITGHNPSRPHNRWSYPYIRPNIDLEDNIDLQKAK